MDAKTILTSTAGQLSSGQIDAGDYNYPGIFTPGKSEACYLEAETNGGGLPQTWDILTDRETDACMAAVAAALGLTVEGVEDLLDARGWMPGNLSEDLPALFIKAAELA